MNGRVLALVLLVSLTSWGCGKDEPPAPSVLTGVITQVAGTGSEVTGFDLQTDGNSYQILIDNRRDYGFALTHLHEHQSSGDPVRVRLQERGEALYALRIDDA